MVAQRFVLGVGSPQPLIWQPGSLTSKPTGSPNKLKDSNNNLSVSTASVRKPCFTHMNRFDQNDTKVIPENQWH